jgi:membrane protease YdiL (CAAX protease family)
VKERWRLALWGAFILVLAGLGYSARLGLFGESARHTPRDVLYRWDTFAGQLLQYLLFLGIVLAISGADRRRLALRQPDSWHRALGLGLGVIGAIYVLAFVLEPLLHGGKEQGLTPDRWEPKHAYAFAANFAVIVLLAPVVEELLFRGLGFYLLEPLGRGAAIVLVGLAFGFYHGLVNAFPLLAAFGIGLAYLRARTGSVYPGMIVHAVFNAIALIGSVTLNT